MNSAATQLPFQHMLSDEPIQVVKMDGFFNERPYYLIVILFMLDWTTAGVGLHLIGFREHEMIPNTL